MAGYIRRIKKDSTSKSVVVKILSLSTALPQTSVSEGQAGLVMKYWRQDGTANVFDVSIAPVSITDLSSAYNSGGIKHIADGWYRVDVPNAAFATGADAVLISVTATAMQSDAAYIELTNYNPQTNTPQSTPEKY